jgi:hypothetical protein
LSNLNRSSDQSLPLRCPLLIDCQRVAGFPYPWPSWTAVEYPLTLSGRTSDAGQKEAVAPLELSETRACARRQLLKPGAFSRRESALESLAGGSPQP